MSYEYKTTPLSHQQAFEQHWEAALRGLFWEPGTGKTKSLLDNGCALYLAGEITCMLVVAPNGVHRNWITDEVPKHVPDSIRQSMHCFSYRTDKSKTVYHKEQAQRALKHAGGLLLIAMSYDGLMTDAGRDYVWKVLVRHRCMYILDEAHNVKSPGAKRTKRVVASGKYAPYRRIATGTPGDKPFDIYSQVKFLDDSFWRLRGLETFAAFKQHYGVWFTAEECKRERGFDPGYDKLLGYKNLHELQAIMQQIGDRVLKEDVLDLPPKLYSRLYFEMNAVQRRAYDELRDEFITELDDGKIVSSALAIVRLLRLQQIACGYVATDDEEPLTMLGNSNPRMGVVEELRDGLSHPAIIWARFSHDVDQIMDVLGKDAVRYDGRIGDDECERSKRRFQAGEAQWFVGNPAKGSEGLTLVQAKTVVYYSNSFKLLQRIQSEDRAHRMGQEGVEHAGRGVGVLYQDIVCPGTVDEKIVSSLREKFDIAAQLTGDRLRSWL